MAEARNQSGDLTRSVIAGSEFEYEFYCHVCQEEGRHLEAEGYCQNCREYLCKTCFDGHCRPRPSRHHILLSKQDMPTSLLAQSKLKKDKSTEKCHIHPGEFIQYYCQVDDTLGCSVCATMNHRNCIGLLYIPDVSGGICDSGEFRNLFEDLSSAKDRAAAIINISKDNCSAIKKNYKYVMKSMQEFRRKIDTTLDKLESANKATADKLKSEDEQKMKTISDNSNATLKNIEAMITSLAMLQSSKQECNLFVAMKNVRATMSSLLLRLDQTEQKNDVRKYQFQPGTELHKLLKGQNAFGKISVINDRDTQKVAATSTRVPTPGAQREVKENSNIAGIVAALDIEDANQGRSPVIPSMPAASPTNIHTNLQVSDVADINVKSKTDKQNCWITGAVALQDNKVIITDYNNNKVKVIDTTSLHIVSTVKLPDHPWDITSVSSREFAVTIPGNWCIVFLTLREDNIIAIGRVLSVNGQCSGIVCREEQLFVSFIEPGKVMILSLNGDVQHTIDTDSTGGQLFDWSSNLAISPDQDTIYVSDCNKHTVTSLSATGQVKAIYKNGQLKYPTGLTTDTEGRVYVCSSANHNISLITDQCEKIKIFLTKDSGLNSNPWALCYCEMTKKLFVGMKSNMVKAYQMK